MMNHPHHNTLTSFMLLSTMTLTLGGCASHVVTPEKLTQRTAFALGLDSHQFTIIDREDDGVSTRYRVKTQDGRTFNCTVGGSFSVMGPVVTDAICHPSGQSTPATQQPNPNCNALLKAAGQC